MKTERDLVARAVHAWAPVEPSFDALRRRRDRRRRNQRIAAGVVAVVVAAIAIGAVSTALLDAKRIPVGLPDAPEAWVRHGIAPGELPTDRNGIYSVTQGGPGLVAVGESDARRREGGYIINGPATVWTSADGSSWTRLLGCAPEGRRCNSLGDRNTIAVGDQLGLGLMFDVTAVGPGLVAVGASGRSPDAAHTGMAGYQDSADAVVWTSTDGSTWSRLADDPVFHDAAMRAVASGPAGLVAVGASNNAGLLGRQTAWFSRDGMHWTRTVLDDHPRETLNDVTPFGEGFVAVGADSAHLPNNGVIWTSSDGQSWTRVADPVTEGIDLEGIAEGPDGLVAVGHAVGGRSGFVPAVLTSTDGVRWTRVDPSEEAFALPASFRSGSTDMGDVAATSAGYVAVGMFYGCPERGFPVYCVGEVDYGVIWTSADGQVWTRVEGPGGVAPDKVAPWGSRFVGVSGEGTGNQPLDHTGSVWVTR